MGSIIKLLYIVIAIRRKNYQRNSGCTLQKRKAREERKDRVKDVTKVSPICPQDVTEIIIDRISVCYDIFYSEMKLPKTYFMSAGT